MNTKRTLLDEHLLDDLDGRPGIIKALTDPLQLGLIAGAILGAFWAARKNAHSPFSERMPIAEGSIKLGER